MNVLNTRNVFNAIYATDTRSLSSLLENGLDPDENVDGVPLVTIAIGAERIYHVILLLAHGADPEKRDRAGKLPLNYISPQLVPISITEMATLLIVAGAPLPPRPIAQPPEKFVVAMAAFLAQNKMTVVRPRMAEICFALQNLRFPAFVTCEILAHTHRVIPTLPFHMQWNLVTTIKHWKERQPQK